MRNLSGKTAVVTGGGSGIGRALAVALARQGCKVALLDVDRVGLEESVAAVPDADVSSHLCDVSDEAAVRDAAGAVTERFGGVHLVVNNAGVAHAGRPFWELPAEDFRRVLDVNFWGVVHGSRAFLPYLMAQPEAVLVNVSSLFGLLGVTRQSAYCASKFAVRGFTESLRMELRESAPHVRAVTVHPGGVKTAIARNSLPAGQSSDLHREEVRAFEQLARTSAPDAARQIVAGVQNGRSRVLVGTDAKLLDVLARSLPQGYTSLLLRQLMKASGPPQPDGSALAGARADAG